MTDKWTEIERRLVEAKGADREIDALLRQVDDPAEFKRQCTFKGMMYAGHVHTVAEKREYTKRTSERRAPKGECTCMDDTCCCLYPEAPTCDICKGESVLAVRRSP